MMSDAFPIHDWQFWAATAVVVIAMGWALRNVLPVPYFSKRSRRAKQSKRVSLTIGGKARKPGVKDRTCDRCGSE